MDAASDPRFRHVATDPRFKAIPKRARKVTIDPRFQSMFTEKRFKVKYSVDKRGKKVKQTSSEDLRKYYQLEEDELPEGTVKKRKTDEDETGSEGKIPSDVDDSGGESPDELSDNESGSEAGSSDSSSTDIDEYLFLDQSEKVIHNWGELDAGVPERDETSHRLAVCNMDWDRVSAQDIHILLNSFKPQGGSIHTVSIFPSDYGLERMKKEDVQGPVELAEGEGVEGGGYSDEKLRQYQLNRLKYYYAVVVCDSIGTAEHIYEQCDGLEYEHSGGKLDLRFIPDEMTFDDREAKSVTNENMISADFKPSVGFFSSALQQSKVHLTWDETDPKRLDTTMRKFTKDDLLSMDFNAYLASSSEEEEEESEGEENVNVNEEQIKKYRSLLREVKSSGDERDEDLEITWEPGLKSTTEELVKRKMALGGQVTPWEKYLQEKKEKRREKKREKAGKVKGELEPVEHGFDDPFFRHDVTMATAHSSKKKTRRGKVVEEGEDRGELELLVMEDDDGKEHFSLKGILKQEKAEGRGKRRKKKKEQQEEVHLADNFHVDVQDPRFAAMYESHLYAPDPADPRYKPTKGMAAIMAERQRRREHAVMEDQRKNISDPSIGSLVKSVKSKAASFKQRKKELKAKQRKKHK